jgi:hypothetical protein
MGIVTGRVLLQGRDRYQGVLVAVSGRSATTDAEGAFRIEGVPAGTHEWVARMPSYLRHRQSLMVYANNEVTMSDILLLAGDINSDDVVDLFDLVAMAIHYGTKPPGGTPEDVNDDGEVDLYDLVLIASNYGARSPGVQ